MDEMNDATLVDETTGEVIPVHPVADLFPLLPDDELLDLAGDISKRGLLQAIVLDKKGRVLDGRNRYRACQRAGVKPEFVTYDGDDPDGYALSVNIARRHLTKGQQAMIAARAMALSQNGTMRSVARSVGVGKSRVGEAAIILAHAPDLADAVVSGATPLNEAYKTAQDRKSAADNTDGEMAALRARFPDLAEMVTNQRLTLVGALAEMRQRETAHREMIGRFGRWLADMVPGLVVLRDLAENKHRDEILASLTPTVRNTIEEIEAIYRKGSK
jgi:hypothetical protein